MTPSRDAGSEGEPIGRQFLLPPLAEREAPAILFGESEPWSWSRLLAAAAAAEAEFDTFTGARVGLAMRPTGPCVAYLEALARLGADVYLLDARLNSSTLAALAERFDLVSIVGGDAPALRRECASGRASADTGSLTILTSGTTGTPKAARHTWEGLRRPTRSGVGPRTWMLAYRPNLYAGLQVIIQCLSEGGCLVAVDDGADANTIIDTMIVRGVRCISATPSWWRRLLIFGDRERFAAAPLDQITLGGEVADQDVLDALRSAHPGARIVHIYATTELGSCFSVTDGKEGFPVSFLERPSANGVELRVVDGELHVRSSNAMSGYVGNSPVAFQPGAWFPTGDLVNVRGDRYVFVGRRSDLINVGGNKVSPIAVERVVREAPGVLDARVFGRRSGIAGQIVTCEVVVGDAESPDDVIERVRRRCLASLASHERPRLVRVVDRIGVTDAGKTSRGVSE